MWKGGDEHTLDLRMERRWSSPRILVDIDLSAFCLKNAKPFGRLKEIKVES